MRFRRKNTTYRVDVRRDLVDASDSRDRLENKNTPSFRTTCFAWICLSAIGGAPDYALYINHVDNNQMLYI